MGAGLGRGHPARGPALGRWAPRRGTWAPAARAGEGRRPGHSPLLGPYPQWWDMVAAGRAGQELARVQRRGSGRARCVRGLAVTGFYRLPPTWCWGRPRRGPGGPGGGEGRAEVSPRAGRAGRGPCPLRCARRAGSASPAAAPGSLGGTGSALRGARGCGAAACSLPSGRGVRRGAPRAFPPLPIVTASLAASPGSARAGVSARGPPGVPPRPASSFRSCDLGANRGCGRGGGMRRAPRPPLAGCGTEPGKARG